MAAASCKRTAEKVLIPAPGEDPTERKRLLNVLAQRRYRRRKKERLQRLEKQAQDSATSSQPQQASADLSQDFPAQDLAASPPNHIDPSALLPKPLPKSSSPNFDDISTDDQVFPDVNVGDHEAESSYFLLNPFDAWDASVMDSMQSLQDSPSFNSSSSSSNSPDSLQCRPLNYSSSSSAISFPDEIHLPVPELGLLRGALAIAKRLNIESLIWSLDSTSPFSELQMIGADFKHLPLNLRPTSTQMTMQHHPVLDLMPWPSVRDKLILIFSQPAEFRPPIAASPTALVELVYDIEDSAEGIRIWGDDPYAAENWELGQKVFDRWWWAFDSRIVKDSNRKREQRGATLLTTDRGSILGEVQ